MIFQFTTLHLTLGGIERSNQDHWVLFIYFIQPPRMEKCDNIIIHSHVHVIQDKSIRHSI